MQRDFESTPSPDTEMVVHRVLATPEATERLGQALGRAVRGGLVIALVGPLGAGKTTFTRGLARGLGLDDRVTSPTFTLVNEYGGHTPGQPRLIHVDAYRLGHAAAAETEAETIGLSDLLDEVAQAQSERPVVLVVEWAERVRSWLPQDRLEIRLDHPEEATATCEDNTRRVAIRALGPKSQAVLAQALHAAEQAP